MLLKKTATLLLILVFIPMMSLSVLANAQEYQTGDIITFGSYPQEGEYAEPLQWIVLDPATGLMLSQKVVDVQPFLDGTEIESQPETIDQRVTPSYHEYQDSSIRKWLNEVFYSSAFSVDEQYLIEETNINNDTYFHGEGTNHVYITKDKVFFLSVEEASNSAYGFKKANEADPLRAAEGTEYALQRGFDTGDLPDLKAWQSRWWLRNPSGLVDFICVVRGNGEISTGMDSEDPYATGIGVRPAITIDLSSLGMKPDRAVGDPDGDNSTTPADARLALRASVKLETLGTWQKRAADADHDGVVSSSDARTLLRASVGLETL